MTIWELLVQLRKPIYVANMNRSNPTPGSRKRYQNALNEIDALVERYASEKDLKRFG